MHETVWHELEQEVDGLRFARLNAYDAWLVRMILALAKTGDPYAVYARLLHADITDRQPLYIPADIDGIRAVLNAYGAQSDRSQLWSRFRDALDATFYSRSRLDGYASYLEIESEAYTAYNYLEQGKRPSEVRVTLTLDGSFVRYAVLAYAQAYSEGQTTAFDALRLYERYQTKKRPFSLTVQDTLLRTLFPAIASEQYAPLLLAKLALDRVNVSDAHATTLSPSLFKDRLCSIGAGDTAVRILCEQRNERTGEQGFLASTKTGRRVFLTLADIADVLA